MDLQPWPRIAKNRKLTEEQATEAILTAKSHHDDKRLAKKFGVSESAIQDIRAGRNWHSLRLRLRAEGRL